MNNKTQKTAKGKGHESHCGTNQNHTKPGGTLTSTGGAGLGRKRSHPAKMGARRGRTSGRDLGTPAGDPRGQRGPGSKAKPKGTGPAPEKVAVPGNGDGVAVEIRLAFSPGEWADIQTSAAYDKTAPAAWAREAVLSWIPETLDAIRRDGLTPEEAAAETASNGRTIAAMRRIMAEAELDLSPDEGRAFALVAGWEGSTFAGFARAAILAFLESSFSEMEGFATGADGYKHGGKQEREWARQWHRDAAPIMARLGFKAGAFRPCRATLPDRPGDPGSGAAGQRGSGAAGKVAFPLGKRGRNSSTKCGGREGLKDEKDGTQKGRRGNPGRIDQGDRSGAPGPGDRNGGMARGAGLGKADNGL